MDDAFQSAHHLLTLAAQQVWYVVTDDPGEQVTMTEKGIFRKYGGRWLYYDRLD